MGSIPGDAPDIPLLEWMRPYLRHCGVSRRKAWKINGRKLLDFLVVSIDEGLGRFTVAGKTYEAKTGDLFWIPPDTVHEMEGFAPDMLVSYIHFDLIYRRPISHWDFSIPGGTLDLSEFAPLMHPPLPPGPLGELCGRIRSPAGGRLAQRIHEACAEATMGQPYAALRVSGILTDLVAQLLRDRARGPEGSSQAPGLEKAAARLQNECQREVPMAEVAALAGLSVSHFRKLFHEWFGMPPREYHRRARIQRAKGFMAENRLNLTEIADQLGFANVHSFSRAFRECEGMSPAAWRRFGKPQVRVEGRERPYAG